MRTKQKLLVGFLAVFGILVVALVVQKNQEKSAKNFDFSIGNNLQNGKILSVKGNDGSEVTIGSDTANGEILSVKGNDGTKVTINGNSKDGGTLSIKGNDGAEVNFNIK